MPISPKPTSTRSQESESSGVTVRFVLFSSVSGFLSYVADSTYVECSGGGTGTNYTCPGVQTPTGPVLLYLQQAGVGRTVRQAGTQEIPQTELAFYIQDTWKPNPRWTIDYGVRWESQIEPDPITPPSLVFFGPFIGKTVTNARGTFAFPSDGTIPSDKGMWQPRFGFAYDPNGDGRQVIRGNAGLYYARIPGLNLASSRSTNGSVGLTYFRNSALTFLGRVPGFGNLLPDAVPQSSVFFPDVFVFDTSIRGNSNMGHEFTDGDNARGRVGLHLPQRRAVTCQSVYGNVCSDEARYSECHLDALEPQFCAKRIKEAMQGTIIVDGRNLYEPTVMKEAGLNYYSIGRTPCEVSHAAVLKKSHIAK